MPEQGRCFNIGQAILPGPVAVKEKWLEAAAENSLKWKKRKRNDNYHGMKPVEAQTAILWLCYTELLAEAQISKTSRIGYKWS